MTKLQIATVFSGIGAPEQALNKMNIDYDIVFACDNDEIELKESKQDIEKIIEGLSNVEKKKVVNELYTKTKKKKYVKQSYFANYDIDEDRWYPDIRFLDGMPYRGKVDIYVGGSPCQSFSLMGKRAGLDDTRGTLFYEYARLINEIQPKAFIFENVPGMVKHDKGNTWKVIMEVFKSLGYDVNPKILNAKDFGIPQDRERLFVVGIKNGDNMFSFPLPFVLNSTMFDFLEQMKIG